MIVTKQISMDLACLTNTHLIHAMQGDANSRSVAIALKQDGKDWPVPDGTGVLVYYQKQDGIQGSYDTLPDGTRAWSADGNVLTISLAPQMLTVAGIVTVRVELIRDKHVLSTFPLRIAVGPELVGGGESEAYFNWHSVFLPQVAGAEAEQYLQIEEVDGDGRILKLKPVDGTLGGASVRVPDYWKEHLSEKIKTIRSLQDAGGGNCFSFLVLTDLHIDANLGLNSPALAKYVMEQCRAKFALCLGDVFTRGVKWTKPEAEEHYAEIEEMLLPIRDRLLQTQGNHDGTYGVEDIDSDGDYDTYLYNYTPAEMFERIYRKVGLVGQVHFDPAGSNAYYIDDVSNRVRFILLNTHCTQWELDENGCAKYNNMHLFRYTQKQYDFLTADALATVPDEHWGVVIGSHVPLNYSGEMPEGDVMMGLLNAYKNKTTYAGTYGGTASGATSTANFTNLFDVNGAGYQADKRVNSDNEIVDDTATFISNYIPAVFDKTDPDILCIKGIDVANDDYFKVSLYDSEKNLLNNYITYDTINGMSVDENGVFSWAVGTVGNYMSSSTHGATAYVRFQAQYAGEIIATINEEITYTETEEAHGYDYVSVEADFSGAKGELVGYFGGHIHADKNWDDGFPVITSRSDAQVENDAALKAERVAGTVTEQSFDVFTVNKSSRKIYATKIGAGNDRVIGF